ncbi:MAG: hypothetical protein OHK0013_15660 [Sandaracinaceae bacterium]
MRRSLTALVLAFAATTSVARADIEVGSPPPTSGSSGCACSAGPGATGGAMVFTALGAIGLASFVSRRRARR